MIKHKFVSAIVDDADETIIRPSNWNADHDFDMDGINISHADLDDLDYASAGHTGDLIIKDNFYQALKLSQQSYPSETEDENGHYYQDGSIVSIQVRGFINIGSSPAIRYYTASVILSCTLGNNGGQPCFITWQWNKARGWDGNNYQNFDGYILDNGVNIIEVGDIDLYEDYNTAWAGNAPTYDPLYNVIVSEYGNVNINSDLSVKGDITVEGDFTINGAFAPSVIDCALIDMSNGLYQIYYTDEYSPRMRFASINPGDAVYEFVDGQDEDDGRMILQMGKSGQYGFQFVGCGSAYEGVFGQYGQDLPNAQSWQLKANDGGALVLLAQQGDMLFAHGDLESTVDLMFFDYSAGKGQIYTPMGFSKGSVLPTAKLHIAAGTIDAGTAPLKIDAGVNLTTPESGAIEWDGTNLYITNSSLARKTIGYDLGFTAVPNTRQVNGHALSSNVTISKSDVGLASVPDTDCTNPANITQDATHRFATDTEKSNWNAKSVLAYRAVQCPDPWDYVPILLTDTFIAYDSQIVGSVSMTLPQASTVPAGKIYYFKDAKGNGVTQDSYVDQYPGDTIDNSSSGLVLNSGNDMLILVCDGVSNWMVMYQGYR